MSADPTVPSSRPSSVTPSSTAPSSTPGSAGRRLLPMLGHTAGKRSAVTCELKCANACFHPVPNESDNPTFRDIAAVALDRRRLIGLAGAGALAIAVGPAALSAAAAPVAPELAPEALAAATTQGSTLRFTPIAPVEKTVDALTVPRGYSWKPIIRWGDPVLPGAPVFDIEAQTAAKQRMQFGYNNDYTDIISTDVHGTRAVLVCNHEYVNPQIMFPADLDAVEAKRIAQAAHGFSVVELERRRPGTPWSTRRSGVRLNRRFHTHSTFAVDGPAAGSELLRTKDDPTGKVVLGTLGNCSGGTTPWGTVLTGEENFNGYFRAAGTTDSEKRYGLKDSATALGWETIEPRFDARTADFVNEPNRFGWIVEIDPMDPNSTPVKHTALGRLKHEGANVIVARSGHVVAYMGDDERFDYLYKFVSKNTYRRGPSPAARAHNKTLLTEGDLYVARFTGDSSLADLDGSGELPQDGQFDGVGSWVPLIKGGRSWIKGMSVDQVLVHTRLAADKVGATKMDRCEDVQPSLATGKVYVVCTNNTDRGKVGKEGATEPNPRNANKDGHIVELTELHGSDGETFVWNLMLVCGDPAAANTYFAGYPKNKVSPISCPDNIAFDSENNMWIATDGAPSALGLADGLFKVPLSGSERGRVQQFLAVPNQAETCGPVVHDRDGLVFVAVQHPGEEGTFDAQNSYFPDYVVGKPKAGQFKGPRPAVVQVYKS